MSATTISSIKARIRTTLRANAIVAPKRASALMAFKPASIHGKLYEVLVLSEIIEKLNTVEGYSIRLLKSSKLVLKQKGGWLNSKYPHFELSKLGKVKAELWNDVYFATLSNHKTGTVIESVPGNYHELDIALIKPGIFKYPKHTDIYIGVECKNTNIEKNIIREVLGFRRELSYVGPYQPTIFLKWPTNQVKANPSSIHLFYCTDKALMSYKANCDEFGTMLEFMNMH
ncbi:hypothetical protein FNT36_04340 [Hymenobacter setariae]|uniref:Uncharacterized protein n=1 Tax=Hymenobacter setariae TaxID=2594794 RepID=A0A558C3J6_9BACT|nr:hypothetical protein [Hymenobacter setariae]TVT43324.1 hypothetical protein FNT36_04340 [Hymenobacter setariae]